MNDVDWFERWTNRGLIALFAFVVYKLLAFGAFFDSCYDFICTKLR